MISCPYCQVPFAPPHGAPPATRCPSCGRRVRLEYGAAARTVALCARHPESHAVETCRRCGNFTCQVCRTRWYDRTFCAECVEHLAREQVDNLYQPQRDHRRSALLALTFGVSGWLLVTLAVVGIVLLASSARMDDYDLRVYVGLLLFAAFQAGGLGAIGVGHGAAAVRLRGDHMIAATVGLVVSCLLVSVLIGLLVTTLIYGP